MPKTRLTAKLCSTPTTKSPGSSDGSPPNATPTTVPVPPVTPTAAAAAASPAVPKSPPTASTLPLSPTKPASSKPPPVTPSPPLLPTLSTQAALASSPATKPKTVMISTNSTYFDPWLHRDACDSFSDSGSDLDDLPEGLYTSEDSSSLPAKGDAVWVKYRAHNFWPSLVLQSNPKSKKLHIVFLDDTPMNGQHIGQKVYMKYNKQKVLPYNHVNRPKFEAEGKSLESTEMRKKFVAALSKMVDYVNKRALGHLADCKAFLDEPISSDDENSTTTTTTVPPASSPARSQTVKTQPVGTPPAVVRKKRKKKEGDKEDLERSLSPTGGSVESDTRRKRVMTPAERRAARKEKNQPLVDYICSNEMKSHLIKIYKGQVRSERHHMYMQGSSQKLCSYSSGPIDDEDQLDKIVDHIGDWHQELTQQKLPNMDYLMWVWLPEAIIHAIKKVRRCGEKKAAEMFEKGIRMTKSEHLEVHNQLMRKF